jgi:hypothetical protein
MKYLSFLFLLFISSVAHSATGDPVDKRFSIGFGTYATVISYDDSILSNDEFSGISLSFAYALSDVLSLRGSYFSQDHDTFSSIESKGFDFLGHVGLNMGSPGFKAYIGGGIFSEEWETGSLSQSFDGLQLSGGIGYNWESVALDFILNLRDASDYENFVNNVSPNANAAAASGSLLLSFRF